MFRRAIISWCVLVATMAGAVGAWAVGPLPEGPALQVRTYIDGAHPDQPALYALLADVAAWPAGEVAGAAAVDWDEVVAEPAAWRGTAVLVAGVDAGGRKRIGLVRRQALWGEAVTQRGVVVRGDVKTGEGVLPVVVWFVDAEDAIGPAIHGQAVRVTGRFLGLWDDHDQHGQARTYPVVVARSVQVVTRVQGEVPGGWWPVGLVAAVLAMGWVVWRVRRRGGGRNVLADRAARRRLRAGVERGNEEGEATEEDLPSDPDAALAALAQRVGADGRG